MGLATRQQPGSRSRLTTYLSGAAKSSSGSWAPAAALATSTAFGGASSTPAPCGPSRAPPVSAKSSTAERTRA
eukprot:6848624-Lingulodinium_polyedra.AAC.1